MPVDEAVCSLGCLEDGREPDRDGSLDELLDPERCLDDGRTRCDC